MLLYTYSRIPYSGVFTLAKYWYSVYTEYRKVKFTVSRIVEYGRHYNATWTIEVREREWLRSVKIDIFKNSQHPINLLINLTWILIDPEVEGVQLREWISMQGSPATVRIWLAGSIDGTEWFTHSAAYQWMISSGYRVEIVGFGPDHWHSWMPSWFWQSGVDAIGADELALDNVPKYTYLSYNRKPRWQREQLVASLIARGLVTDRAWVTYESGHFPVIDSSTGATDRDRHSADARYTRPEDLTSLGDLSLWRSSYCIVVTETEYTDPWQITEKTWKPIVGLRPFLTVGHPGVTEVLARLGFYTTRDFFPKFNTEGSIESAGDIVAELMTLTPEQLHERWIEQRPMLEHNRARFIELATSEDPARLGWPQSQRPNSG